MEKEGSSNSEYAIVRKDIVLAYFICSLCNQIISNPTTIIECLHIFCQQCIHDKIVKDKCHHCPKCYKFIGINPLSKIRPNPLKMYLRDPLCEQQENPKHKVIEESSSSTALGLGGSNVPTATKTMITTKKRSNSGRKKRVMASEGSSGRSEDSPVRSSSLNHTTNPAISNPKTGCPKQGKVPGQAGKTNVLSFDLNMPPPPESPSPPRSTRPTPTTIVFALPSPALATGWTRRSRRSP